MRNKDDTILLAMKALLEVVQSASKSMEVAVMERGKPLQVRDKWWYLLVGGGISCMVRRIIGSVKNALLLPSFSVLVPSSLS